MTVAAVVSVIGAIISVIGALIALGSQPGPQIMPQMTYRTLIIPADSSSEQKVDATAMKEQGNDPSTSSLVSASTGSSCPWKKQQEAALPDDSSELVQEPSEQSDSSLQASDQTTQQEPTEN